MGSLDDEIRDLREKTAHTRYEFLKAEIETCCTALGMAQYELSIGNADFATKEVGCVLEGIRTVERFLPETSLEQRSEIETKVAQLRALLEPLQIELEWATGPRESGTS